MPEGKRGRCIRPCATSPLCSPPSRAGSVSAGAGPSTFSSGDSTVMKLAHRVFGVAFVAMFLATGAYMWAHFPSAYQEDAGMRMMFRSAHVFILLSALLNLLAGAHLRTRTARWRRLIQGLGS